MWNALYPVRKPVAESPDIGAETDIRRAVARRRTFAIISHPDAGKTTVTEKLLLFGNAIQLAGTVKARKSRRHAASDAERTGCAWRPNDLEAVRLGVSAPGPRKPTDNGPAPPPRGGTPESQEDAWRARHRPSGRAT